MTRLLALACSLTVAVLAHAADPEALAFFELKVRPILVEQCYTCHGEKKQKGGLQLDSRDALRKGGENGPVVVAGKPGESRLIRAVRYTDKELRMPPDKKLRADQIAELERWVQIGAPDPRDGPPGSESANLEWDKIVAERRNWWSLQPVRVSPVPDVADKTWPANPVDRFILAKLEAAKLRPAPLADRVVLARRLSFVLTGLPPTPEIIRDFVDDQRPDALERLVDRLLADPALGERWSRHWMDVVRYADTYGYEWDIPARGSWRYRDYLIRAFNADVPFDQLVREQLAGDLLPNPRINREEGINESRIGPMFFQLGEKRHGDSAQFNGIHQEMLDNKIDAFSKAFQAMTVSCARCHDHKLDAVAQRDYYALAGLFMSPRWVANTLDTPDRNRETIGQLRQLKAKLRAAIGEWWKSDGLSSEPWGRIARTVFGREFPLEHPLRPWQVMVKADGEKKDIAAAWKALAASYKDAARTRVEQNTKNFRTIADFRDGLPVGWSIDGVGLRDGPVRAGDFTVALTGDRVIDRVLGAGLITNSLSPRLNGALRSPFLNTLDRKLVSFLVEGGDFAAERTVIDNAFLTERQSYVSGPMAWKQYSTFPEMKERSIYIEFATKASNPNFPPRVGLGPDLTDAQINDPRSWFAISRIVAHDAPGSPADELTRFKTLFDGDVPDTMAEVAERYSKWFRIAINAWAENRANDDHILLLNWLLQNSLLPNGDMATPPKEVTELVTAYRATESKLLDPATANGMTDLDLGQDYRVNLRGDYDRLGESVPRNYLQIFAKGGRPVVPKSASSGRLALAEFVASRENSLTARVYVNRVWHWLFGAGLVTTPDDFGHLGDRPSHPELLDWLSNWFVDNGWSTKKLIRLLVLSQTFRQSGEVDPAAKTADARNRLWHHYPLRRLEAEAVRDSLLSVSGRLNRQLYGPPINPPRTAEDPQKRLFSGPLDGDGRRSIYTKSTIMDPPRFLATFNQPPAKIPTGRRDITNVPAQALAMLNDPFVIGQAQVWGDLLARRPNETLQQRIAMMFETGYGRLPTPPEVERWSTIVHDFAGEHRIAEGAILQSPAIWKDAAHALFNTKEFIYIR
jgi:hypothetical protein